MVKCYDMHGKQSYVKINVFANIARVVARVDCRYIKWPHRRLARIVLGHFAANTAYDGRLFAFFYSGR